MNVVELIEKYGDMITFVGGINKFFNWTPDEQKLYLIELLSSKKRFLLMDSGAIPENVGVKEWNYFNILRRLLK